MFEIHAARGKIETFLLVCEILFPRYRNFEVISEMLIKKYRKNDRKIGLKLENLAKISCTREILCTCLYPIGDIQWYNRFQVASHIDGYTNQNVTYKHGRLNTLL